MLHSRLSRVVGVGNCQKLQSGPKWQPAKGLTNIRPRLGPMIGDLALFHSRRIFPMRAVRRMAPSKSTAAAIWKLGLLKRLSFLPIPFNVREY